ncbi:Uncharacterized protein APZ42_009295, partial [Daphnia magna]
GSWLQVTADQLINCRLEEVTSETECANCTISSPIGDIPGGINGSVSHNLVTIVWKESLREVQQCKLRLVETEKNYKQVIGMDKAILRLHSLTDTNAHLSKPLEEDIENIADIIRAEISGAPHSQYARHRTTDGINGVQIDSHCCGTQPKLGNYTLDTEGWELTPYNPFYWHKNFVNINGRAHFYKNSSLHPIVPGVIIQGHSLINILPYEIDKLLALSLLPALTLPMSTEAAITEIIAAAKEEHGIDLGNPFHMSTLLSSLQKEKNVPLSSKILSWSSSICSLLGMGFIGFIFFHFCGVGSLIARYLPCCSFL